jgi:hypothetical protein
LVIWGNANIVNRSIPATATNLAMVSSSESDMIALRADRTAVV